VKTLNVLLVDDDPAQADLLLECSDIATTRWTFATDGYEALYRLRSDAASLPDLVLLDLNLPGMDGHEVLRTIRSDGRLRLLPVIIFSHSDARRDVIAAYDGGANCYIRKPFGLDELQETIAQLETFMKENEDGYHMLLFENSTKMPFAVAATAWDNQLGCPTMNPKVFDALRTFREAHIDKGPEVVP